MLGIVFVVWLIYKNKKKNLNHVHMVTLMTLIAGVSAEGTKNWIFVLK